jgi:Mg2+-importing ATPase
LGFVPLPASYWYWIGGFLLGYAFITHHVKVWFHKKYGID